MRRVLVTGASSGIGRAVAQRQVRQGDFVIACGMDRTALASLTAELGPAHARSLVLDVSDASRIRTAFDELPTLDVLVLSAGVCERARLDADDTEAVWDRVLAVNLRAVYTMIVVAAPRMSEGGRIIAIASGLGKLGRAGYSAYCASKHGVLGVVKCAAQELAPRGITVNAVCPGWVDTPMARGDVARTARERDVDPGEIRREVERAIPIGRMVSSDEVAALVEWLASPAAGAVTGEAYNISGGEFFA